MKYILIIAATCLFGSCKKGHMCYCTNADGSPKTYENREKNGTKRGAKKSCEELNTLYSKNNLGGCTLKY